MTITEPRPLSITSAVVDGVGHLRLTGEFDMVGAEAFDTRIAELGRLEHVHVNLSAVTFLDSMAIRSLVRCHDQQQSVGGAMTLDQPSEVVRRLLALVGLDQVFDITGID